MGGGNKGKGRKTKTSSGDKEDQASPPKTPPPQLPSLENADTGDIDNKMDTDETNLVIAEDSGVESLFISSDPQGGALASEPEQKGTDEEEPRETLEDMERRYFQEYSTVYPGSMDRVDPLDYVRDKDLMVAAYAHACLLTNCHMAKKAKFRLSMQDTLRESLCEVQLFAATVGNHDVVFSRRRGCFIDEFLNAYYGTLKTLPHQKECKYCCPSGVVTEDAHQGELSRASSTGSIPDDDYIGNVLEDHQVLEECILPAGYDGHSLNTLPSFKTYEGSHLVFGKPGETVFNVKRWWNESLDARARDALRKESRYVWIDYKPFLVTKKEENPDKVILYRYKSVIPKDSPKYFVHFKPSLLSTLEEETKVFKAAFAYLESWEFTFFLLTARLPVEIAEAVNNFEVTDGADRKRVVDDEDVSIRIGVFERVRSGRYAEFNAVPRSKVLAKLSLEATKEASVWRRFFLEEASRSTPEVPEAPATIEVDDPMVEAEVAEARKANQATEQEIDDLVKRIAVLRKRMVDVPLTTKERELKEREERVKLASIENRVYQHLDRFKVPLPASLEWCYAECLKEEPVLRGCPSCGSEQPNHVCVIAESSVKTSAVWFSDPTRTNHPVPEFATNTTLDRKCTYPFCDENNAHTTYMCPILHARCSDCRRRGHRSDTVTTTVLVDVNTGEKFKVFGSVCTKVNAQAQFETFRTSANHGQLTQHADRFVACGFWPTWNTMSLSVLQGLGPSSFTAVDAVKVCRMLETFQENLVDSFGPAHESLKDEDVVRFNSALLEGATTLSDGQKLRLLGETHATFATPRLAGELLARSQSLSLQSGSASGVTFGPMVKAGSSNQSDQRSSTPELEILPSGVAPARKTFAEMAASGPSGQVLKGVNKYPGDSKPGSKVRKLQTPAQLPATGGPEAPQWQTVNRRNKSKERPGAYGSANSYRSPSQDSLRDRNRKSRREAANLYISPSVQKDAELKRKAEELNKQVREFNKVSKVAAIESIVPRKLRGEFAERWGAQGKKAVNPKRDSSGSSSSSRGPRGGGPPPQYRMLDP